MAAGLALTGLSACDKGTDLGVDLPGASDLNARYQDFPLAASTVRFDSLSTLKADHFLAGRLRDNVAGLTTARAYLNLVLFAPDSLPARFSAPVLDSLVFVAGFDQVYGSASTPVRFDLFQLATPINGTDRYTSADIQALNPVALATDMTGRLDAQVRVGAPPTGGGDSIFTFVPTYTLRLPIFRVGASTQAGEAFARRLFAASSVAGFNQSQLTSQFGSLALVPNFRHESAVVSFGRSTDLRARLALYFHEQAAPRRKRTCAITFGPSPGGSGAASANDPRYYTAIDFNPSGTALAPLASASSRVPSASTGDVTYVQDGLALGTRLEMPITLGTLANDKNLAINRAEILLPVKPYSNGLLPAARGIFALEVDNQNQLLRRQNSLLRTERVVQADGAPATGSGNESLATLRDANTAAPYYLLPVSTYLQAYLSNSLGGPLPSALVLLPTVRRSQNLTLDRSVITTSGDRTPRLRVYYSKLR